jgi:hypothetical protein
MYCYVALRKFRQYEFEKLKNRSRLTPGVISAGFPPPPRRATGLKRVCTKPFNRDEVSMNYSGIDLHSNNSVVAVIDETNRVVAEKRLPNDMRKILAFLARGPRCNRRSRT